MTRLKNLKTILNTRPEHKLLIACLKSHMDQKNALDIKELLTQKIDWDYFHRIVALHGVLPIIYTNLKNIAQDSVPVKEMNHLKEQYLANVQRNLILTGELLKIMDLFESNGIEAIPLKGPVFAESVYGSLSLRQFVDLDILVRKKNVLKAKSLLLSNKYNLLKKIEINEEVYLIERNDFEFLKEEGRIRVELHWDIISKIYHFPLDLDKLWENTHKISFAGATVLNFSSEDLFIIHCIHGTKHNWKRLKWICDISKLIEANPEVDLNCILKLAKSIGGERVLSLGLFLANDLLGAQLPDQIKSLLQSNRAVHSLAQQVYKWLFTMSDYGTHKTPLFRIKARERYRDKIVILARNIYWVLAPNEKDRYFLSLPSFLSFLYFVVKPIRLISQYGFGFVFSLKKK